MKLLDKYKKSDIISDLYFECHVTIEPVFDEDLLKVTEISKKYNFKPANLLMQKRKEDTPQRSQYDTFCTGHSKSFLDIKNRMNNLINELKSEGFKVWRYKIEDTLCDSKLNDEYGLL